MSAVQGFTSSQSTGVPPQTPAVHTSLDVQKLPSSHGVSDCGVCAHVPSTQLSAVQGFVSSHSSSVAQHPSTGVLAQEKSEKQYGKYGSLKLQTDDDGPFI